MKRCLFFHLTIIDLPLIFVNLCMFLLVEGAMPVYSLDAVQSSLKSSNELFITAGFMYYLEDSFLSLKLWANGYKCIVLPIIVGSHYRMGTSTKAAKKSELFYYLLRNRIALLYATNSRGKLGFITQNIRKLVVSNRTAAERKAILVALIDGLRLGKKLRRKYGCIDFYAAPFSKGFSEGTSLQMDTLTHLCGGGCCLLAQFLQIRQRRIRQMQLFLQNHFGTYNP